ncbi:DUF4399 domain-containing protein [Accumulibacter sp.]|uniref:DUF4399 domain-containing protein n=1 Tax=Accumulibacter sp. TaxID=2053492 RepID=UPI0025DA15B0|nr:DUF4399 domain-containing protein [Accumulibacter sp.]MCM8594522.1 DUF4399 domain-containing protein [Accumulibacter sp.]MCM8626788.1 DUF4399 domain-containing protein [Accumulibacter sp.]MDS4048668.1 DUF4399 domain-containing protein [Accumulibacter sp.]
MNESSAGPALLLALLLPLMAPIAHSAARLPDDPLERRCWLQYTADRTSVSLFADSTPVTFSNLRDGFHVRTPFWVEFGIRGMGVIPAGNKREKSGHHHLLIDTPMPNSVTEPIPFSDKYRHFGKGQTATAIDLPPGQHSLRLLFADYDHRPYYVFSRKITVTVTGPRNATPKPRINPEHFSESCALWYQDEVSTPPAESRAVYLKNLRDGETVDSPFLVKLGAVGFGVAPERTSIPETGHFLLTVRKNRTTVSTVHLGDGQTEAVLDLGPGDYDLEFSLLSGDHKLLLRDQLRLSVASQASAQRR